MFILNNLLTYKTLDLAVLWSTNFFKSAYRDTKTMLAKTSNIYDQNKKFTQKLNVYNHQSFNLQ